MCISIYVSMYVSMYRCIYRTMYISVYLSIYPSMYLFAYPSAHLSIYLWPGGCSFRYGDFRAHHPRTRTPCQPRTKKVLVIRTSIVYIRAYICMNIYI